MIFDTVSRSFSFDPRLWEEVENLRFCLRYNTMTELVLEAMEAYLDYLDQGGKPLNENEKD